MDVALAIGIGLVGLVSMVALVVALAALRAVREPRKVDLDSPLPTDVEGLRAEVQALRIETADALKHLAVVRYDAFGDMGGHLSWSLALLDDRGDGVVLTSITGRSDSRSYAKNVTAWSCEQQLSPEEEAALSYARNG